MITRITGVLNRVLDEEVRLQVGALEYQVLIPEFLRRGVQSRALIGAHRGPLRLGERGLNNPRSMAR